MGYSLLDMEDHKLQSYEKILFRCDCWKVKTGSSIARRKKSEISLNRKLVFCVKFRLLLASSA